MPIIAFLVILVGPEWPKFQDEGHELDAIVGQRHFDFLVWEVRALAAKGEALLTSGHKYLTEETRKQLVLDYLQQLGQVRRLEAEISTIYADPAIEDPDSATRELQVQVDGLRSELTRIQPVAEPILQEQVAFVLAGLAPRRDAHDAPAVHSDRLAARGDPPNT
jgi:hypothetical protein